MPRKSATPSLADRNAAAGGVAAVDRALSVLGVFSATAPMLGLADIAALTQMHKSTVLRLLASLEHAHLVQRQPDGCYALGAGIVRLHQIYAASFSLESVIMPALRQLVAQTKESAAFHVQQGDRRLCLHRVDSPRPVRDHIRVGDLLPLNRGAGGRVLMAFSGAHGPLYTRIRREQVVVLVGDRVPELAGIAAPVFGPDGGLVGALTLTMPADRFDAAYDQPVTQAARRLTMMLGGHYPEPPVA
ncbi:IclR family transcriptional regulator [Bordetella flabilis]|uniref:IclR family transcriptional regulator n=1 Tax=Bordetella flabilis TaxID=463014 RepID=A0A193GHE3_9BORD|nr:IclR family transcriptional regulator [Bordetella flabilis]ANN79487.1 IclR family transcriptional regulator [Bordetella flabilis]